MKYVRLNILSLFFLLSFCSGQNCEDCSINSWCQNCVVGFENVGEVCTSLGTCCQLACVECTDGQCTMCLIGYSLVRGGVCVKCPSYCLECSSDSVCSLCVGDYFVSDGGCVSSQWIGCLVLENDYSCILCDEYFSFNFSSGVCQNCPSKCIYCTNSTNCELCQDHYYLSLSKGGMKCSICNISCINNCYGNSTNCTVCNINEYELQDECLPCQKVIPFCVTCVLVMNSSSPICNICGNQMFVSINGSCLRCSQGCYSCANGTFCVTCKAKFYMNSDNLCEPCGIENCLICKEQKICEICNQNYFVSQNIGLCTLCPQNCNICNLGNGCIQCMTGFYFNSNLTCSQCILNCQICTSKNPFHCLDCSLGFFLLSERQVVKCLPCPEYCPICQKRKDSFICTSYCVPGFVLNENYVCVACSINNCFNCNETDAFNECAICNSGFYLTELGQCNECSVGCGVCQNISICTVCLDGYFDENGQCLSCPIECSYCNSTTCLSCAQGFFLSSLDQAQTLCQSCPIGCVSCLAENICTLCQSGYYLQYPSFEHPLLQICSPCESPCQICSTNSICMVCQRGFSLNSTRQCSPCRNNFAFCDKEIGYKCLDRFVLVLDFDRAQGQMIQKCISCEIGCERCEYKKKQLFCIECSLGFMLNQGQCFQCGMTNLTQGCLSCISDDICQICLYGFTLQNGKCINTNFGVDSCWSLIIVDIFLGCFFMVLLMGLLIQRSWGRVEASSISMELTEGK